MEQRQKTGSSPFLKKPFGGISAMTLRLLAIFCMLLDHMWATLVPGNSWMTFLGRLAFPIFAFQISEGFLHTADVRRYARRLLLFALLLDLMKLRHHNPRERYRTQNIRKQHTHH